MTKLDSRPSAARSMELIEQIASQAAVAAAASAEDGGNSGGGGGDDECAKLARIVRKIQPFLRCIQEREAPQGHPRLIHAMLLIRSALQSLRGALGDAAPGGCPIASVAELQQRVKQSSADLATALQQIPLDEAGVPRDVEEDIPEIVKDIGHIRYQRVLAAMRAAEEEAGADQDALQGGWWDGQSYWKEMASFLGPLACVRGLRAREPKAGALFDCEPDELFSSAEVVAAAAPPLPPPLPLPPPSLDMTPPDEFLCPISKQLMKDPVIMFQSGLTYDRSEIEGWFLQNNLEHKQQQQHEHDDDSPPLITVEKQIAPNMVLRRQVTEWRRARNLPIPPIEERTYDEICAKGGVIWPLAEDDDGGETGGDHPAPRRAGSRPSHLVTTLWTTIPYPASARTESAAVAAAAAASERKIADYRLHRQHRHRPDAYARIPPAPADVDLDAPRWRGIPADSSLGACIDMLSLVVRIPLTFVAWLPMFCVASVTLAVGERLTRSGRPPDFAIALMDWADRLFEWIWPVESAAELVVRGREDDYHRIML